MRLSHAQGAASRRQRAAHNKLRTSGQREGGWRQFSHCAFLVAHLSLHIGDDIYGITSSKSTIHNPQSTIGIASIMKT